MAVCQQGETPPPCGSERGGRDVLRVCCVVLERIKVLTCSKKNKYIVFPQFFLDINDDQSKEKVNNEDKIEDI